MKMKIVVHSILTVDLEQDTQQVGSHYMDGSHPLTKKMIEETVDRSLKLIKPHES